MEENAAFLCQTEHGAEQPQVRMNAEKQKG